MVKRLKRENGKIFCPLADSWHIETPEEKVRQEYIKILVENYGYSLDQMAQEIKVNNSQRGQGKARADIVIWKSKQDKIESKAAFIVVECKAENVRIREEDYYQGYNYASWAGASFFVTTNFKYFDDVNELLKTFINRINPDHKSKIECNLEDLRNSIFYSALTDENGNILVDENGNKLLAEIGITDTEVFQNLTQAYMPKNEKIIKDISLLSPLISLQNRQKCRFEPTLKKCSCNKASRAKKPYFKRLSAQTKRPETGTKRPEVDTLTKRLEIS